RRSTRETKSRLENQADNRPWKRDNFNFNFSAATPSPFAIAFLDVPPASISAACCCFGLRLSGVVAAIVKVPEMG
ncbi:hypothetical protein, partial [Paracidovorax avenae]|uniref:hypothetical protein n=1 Tax=Paracidovorax avenae TaxID=80867 RepID=UPI001CEF8E6C